jgi:hypothetical protein
VGGLRRTPSPEEKYIITGKVPKDAMFFLRSRYDGVQFNLQAEKIKRSF